MGAWREERLNHRQFLLLGGFAVTTIAQFVFVSLMAIYLSDRGLSAFVISIATLVLQVTQRCFGPLIGALIDRWGVRHVYLVGILLSSTGYLTVVCASASWQYLLCVTVLGFGLCCDAITRSTLLVQFSDSKEQGTAALALSYVVFNLAASIGPAISSFGLFYGLPSETLFVAAGFLNAFTGMAYYLFFPYGLRPSIRSDSVAGLRRAWSDREFRRVLYSLPAVWFVFFQMHSVVPLFLLQVFHVDKAIIVSMFTLNAILVVIFAYKANALLRRALAASGHPKAGGIALGTLLMAVGLLTLLLVPWFGAVGVYLFMIVFSFGELCFVPMIQAIVNEQVPSTATSAGPYFGLAYCASGIGAGLSNFVGGALVELADAYGAAWFPLVLAVCGLAASAYYAWVGCNSPSAAKNGEGRKKMEGEKTRKGRKPGHSS